MRRSIPSALLVTGLLGSAIAISGSAAATTGFGAHVDYTVGTNPTFAAAGDLNNDGNLDLVTANFVSNNASVLLNNGNGSFQAKNDYTTGNGARSVTTGDFNGDGNLDLAVANSTDSTVSILLGNGDGTFQAKTDYATGTAPRWVTTGDFNGDGKLDLALASPTDQTVSVLLGNGNGTFQPKVDYATGGPARAVTTGDFNGDGKLDLATANGNSTASVLLGNGNGTFQAHADYATGGASASIPTGDFNGDGILDLATANNTTNNISVLLGNGNGTFQAHVDYPTDPGPFSVSTGDFNGDGILDLASANGNADTVSVLLGNGNGTFQPKVNYPLPTGSGANSVVAANLHSRGTLDLVTANANTNNLSVLLNNAPSPLPYSKKSTMQYTLTGSNGTTWVPMDTANLQQRVVPACTCQAVLTANSSLWTNTANLNQDIGLEVSGGKYGYYPGTLVAWEESGSGSNLFSPNAATVKTKVDVQSGVAYTVTLVWKSNHATSTGQIWAAGGPAGGPYSPTTLLTEMPGWP